MKALFILGDKVSPLVVTTTSSTTNDNNYYNLSLGKRGRDMWCANISMDSRYFKHVNGVETLCLSDDNYDIKEVIKKGKPVKDSKGNSIYYITINNTAPKDQVIAKWTPHTRKIKSYKFKGEITELTKGSKNAVYDNNKYVVDEILFLIYGESVIEYVTDKDGKDILNTITINENGESNFVSKEL